ncbi:MAG: FAH family protein [Burkholderiales bacterium]|nr:FAH family protein [Burkholderiales bacterium]
MRLLQFTAPDGARRVGIVHDADRVETLDGVDRMRTLALDAARRGHTLAAAADARRSGASVDYAALRADGRVLPPLDHPEPTRCLVTGTGLSHLGSAAARDAMHAKLAAAGAALTDSMKVFKAGLDGGRPAPGAIGALPEWFWKGDGDWVVAPGAALERPAYAGDGGEEVELVGLYVVADDGTPLRLGFALANEYSDHVTERSNYLYLAHSKLRECSFGPELRVGPLPDSVHGHARLLRGDAVVWSADWLSGEANMNHSIANLEHHHFRHDRFRRPGDVHVHFLGAATGSFTAGVETRIGDVFEIAAETFGEPLRNPLGAPRTPLRHVAVRAL